ncbi:secreted aspartic proteinase precursor [Apiospora arundinis]
MAGFTHACLMAVMCLAFFSALVESVPVVDSSTFSASVASSIKRHRHVDPRVQYMRTLAKYNIPVPEKLRKIATTKMSKMAKSPTDDGLQAVSVDGDEYFIAPVGIGSPPQQLYLDFDTGSSDSWVFSTDTDVSEVKGQTIYDPLKSSTAVLLPNTTWEIVYGDFSSSSGIVYKDTLSLGSMNIVNMTIESAQDVSSTFTKDFKMSGLLGLAWPSIAQTMPVQDVLLDYLPQMLKEPLFTVDLRHNSDKGSYNFGFIDHNLHGSQIQYINIDNSEGFWGVQMTGYAISGQDVRYEFSTPKSVIVDTGTTLFYAPPNLQSKTTSGPYLMPTFLMMHMATSCLIGDVTGERIVGRIPGSYIAYQSLTDAVGEDEPWDPSFEGQCYAGLQSLGGFSTPDGILGDVWLKAGFHVFDVANKKFGTAPKPLDSTNKKLGHFRRDKLPFYRKKKIGV